MREIAGKTFKWNVQEKKLIYDEGNVLLFSSPGRHNAHAYAFGTGTLVPCPLSPGPTAKQGQATNATCLNLGEVLLFFGV